MKRNSRAKRSMMLARRPGAPSAGWSCSYSVLLAAAVVSLSSVLSPVLAQAGPQLDARTDAQDARNDAVLSTPNLATPVPLSNLYSTAPDLERQIPAPQWRSNLLAPLGYNSNAEEIARGGTQTLETTPVGNLSWAAPIEYLPLRVTLNANAQSDRYFRAPDVDVDKLGAAVRVQYVNPTNDQAFSPYFAVAPRWDFLPTFLDQISARQDFNLGFNKAFNFDGGFRPIPIASNTSASTVWSFGLTAFVQRRLREPQDSSTAVFVIPSVSYVISGEWNASFAVEFFNRWFDVNSVGFSRRDLEALPIGTLEYVIPSFLFGSERMANALGRPALDFQASYLKVWSSFAGGSFNQWAASATLKMGWRF